MSGPGPSILGFEPILKEKVWGGRRLERYGKRLEPGRSYGESWELADLTATAASGGGGGSARSVIDRGVFRGRTIGAAIGAWGADLLGEAVWSRVSSSDATPEFPLLVKFLDAREHLSVQVHPSPAFAAAHDWAHLKTESWLVLEADDAELPGGRQVRPTVFKGIEPGVDAEGFAASIRSGEVVGHLSRHAAVPGECHTLPSGTCHALGAGVLVLEVQTPSDTTFRVYDWAAEYGRSGRELHIDDAKACLAFDTGGGQSTPRAVCGPVGPVGEVGAGSAGEAVVSETDWYRMRSVRCGPDGVHAVAGDGVCRVVVGLSGVGRLDAGGFGAAELDAGRTLLVPACVDGFSIAGGTGGTGGTGGFSACVIEVL